MKTIQICLLIILTVGCSTTKKVEYRYSNPKISLDKKELQWRIDEAECLQKSYSIQSPQLQDCSQIRGNFARGHCAGSNASIRRDSQHIRNKIFDGCLAKKGYEKQIIE